MNHSQKLTNIRNDFPIFKERPELVYLDSTATALKPRVVIESLSAYYQKYSANINRGLYPISEEATRAYSKSRQTVAQFIGAVDPAEVIFVRGTTEALNLIAYTLGRVLIDDQSEILTTVVEHHANFVPWQQLAAENGAAFKVLEMDSRGLTHLDDLAFVKQVVSKRTKLVALNYVSNVLGTINPLKQIIKNIREVNQEAVIVVDAAQAAPCLPLDVKDLDCDFLAFSGHKTLGPTGIGVLWGRRRYLELMPPFEFGGDMIKEVRIEESTFAEIPHKFEAGTPHIAGAIGLAAALSYLSSFAPGEVLKHEQNLWQLTYDQLKKNPNITFLTGAPETPRVGILAFNHQKIHAHDLSQILAEDNVSVRAGHHCAMPLHTAYEVPASCRLSFYLYNTEQEVELFLKSLKRAEKIFLG